VRVISDLAETGGLAHLWVNFRLQLFDDSSATSRLEESLPDLSEAGPEGSKDSMKLQLLLEVHHQPSHFNGRVLSDGPLFANQASSKPPLPLRAQKVPSASSKSMEYSSSASLKSFYSFGEAFGQSRAISFSCCVSRSASSGRHAPVLLPPAMAGGLSNLDGAADIDDGLALGRSAAQQF
jgi:hypothetical protein